jgi:hypothetical protein
MAKRDNGGKRNTAAAITTTAPAATATTDAMEQRVVAFAEQLGRIVGTVQAKTEGWMDRDALNKQVAGVRDSATELLEQLKTKAEGAADTAKQTVTNAATTAKQTVTNAAATAKQTVTRAAGTAKKSAIAATSSRNAGRSGGAVDAPGKKHRKPAPKDPRAMAADAKTSNMRSAKASMKTMKKRGRG